MRGKKERDQPEGCVFVSFARKLNRKIFVVFFCELIVLISYEFKCKISYSLSWIQDTWKKRGIHVTIEHSKKYLELPKNNPTILFPPTREILINDPETNGANGE